MMIIILVLLTIECAYLATQSPHLIHATLWLAGVSALTAILVYAIGAWTVAIVELSVGTGLVTVLLVFAITMIVDERDTIVIKRLSFTLVMLTLLIILMFTVPVLSSAVTSSQQLFSTELWQDRELDMLVQIALIFAGVLGVLGLLRISNPNQNRPSEQLSDHQYPLQEQEAR